MRMIVEKAIEQLIPQWEWLLEELKSFIELNPNATQADAASHIAALESPYALSTLQISDPVAALAWFVSQTKVSWAQVKQFVINNPVDMLRKYEPGEGKHLDITGNQAKIIRVINADDLNELGWIDTIGSKVKPTVFRDPSPGPTHNFVIRKVWTTTLDGESVTIQQIFDNQFDGKRVTVRPGPYEIM